LNYKNDLEALIEEQTNHLDQKNKKMFAQEQDTRSLQASLD
jgi:hypothetical protein